MSCAVSGLRITGRQSLLPVTALEFCTVSDSLYLLAGEGPQMKVLSPKRGLIAQDEILPFCNIHGIRPSRPPSHHHNRSVSDDVSESCSVLVFGQKSLRFVALQARSDGDSLLRIESSSSPLDLVDWILDVCWLASVGDGLCRVAAVTAHNIVHTIECSKDKRSDVKVLAVYHCEINCILYSARLEVASTEIAVLSGTVFNDILLWGLTGEQCRSPTTTDLQSTTNGRERERVRLTLSGHEGVIFSIRMDADGSRVVSVSDDRTVRVWDLPPDWKSMDRCCLSSCSLMLYGHTARVWDGRLLRDWVVSIGEDATCRVWDDEGRCVRVVDGHRGRSIWSMAVDETSGLVATGGGDCSIRLFSLQTDEKNTVWSLDSTLPICGPLRDANEAENTPRSVYLCGKTVLCLSNNGSVYAAEVSRKTAGTVWQLVHSDREFSGYAVMSLSPNCHWLALGSLQGSIATLHLKRSAMLAESNVKWAGHKGKVFSLTWLEELCEHHISLLSCGPGGEMVIWGIPAQSSLTTAPAVVPLVYLSLPPSKHRWVTAVILLPILQSSHSSATSSTEYSSQWIVCGDRKGSIHVYQIDFHREISQLHAQLVQSLRGVHGANGVTHITLRSGLVTSCGRDGHCRTFSAQPHTGLVELTHCKPVKGMDWVERQYQSDTNHLVLGFHGTDMVLYSVTENRQLLRLPCGGGHRSYGFTAFSELLKTKEAVVVFIKKSVISLRVVDLTSVLVSPVLQRGFVGREAISLQLIHSDPSTGHAMVAVGSEDSSICLLSLRLSSDSGSLAVKSERFIQGHISSVRALSTSSSVQGGGSRLLFSGGARASLKAWRINVGGGSGESDEGPEVTLEAEMSIHDDPDVRRRGKIRRKKPKGPGAQSLLPECRIMALTSLPLAQVLDEDLGRHYVAVGCSDGIIRHYVYGESSRSFTSLGNLQFHNRCILTMNHILPSPSSSSSSLSGKTRELYLLSAATDGRVAVWRPQLVGPLSGGVKSDVGEWQEVKSSSAPLVVCQSHQSGINDLAIQQVREGSYRIATVGDDNSVAVLRLTLTADRPQLSVLSTECSAHSSSITGASFLSANMLVTSSIDQRLNVWRVSQPVESTDTASGGEASRGPAEAVSLELVSSHTHDIADASSLCLYSERGTTSAVAVICGIGLQCFAIDCDYLTVKNL